MTVSGQPIPVLVVDDDAVFGTTVKDFLDGEGYRVAVATTYEQATDALAHVRFRLVLTDAPRATARGLRDPWGTVGRIRELAADAQVVIITAFHPTDFDGYRDRGFHGVLAKPFALDDLRAILPRQVAGVS